MFKSDEQLQQMSKTSSSGNGGAPGLNTLLKANDLIYRYLMVTSLRLKNVMVTSLRLTIYTHIYYILGYQARQLSLNNVLL